MSAPTSKPPRLFTLEQANATLPLVRMIMQDIVELANGIRDRKQRLESLSKERPARGMELYRDELEQTELDIDKDAERLQAYVDELLDIGVELRSPLDGAVDFPSEQDGKPSLLQWRLGQPSVSVSRGWDGADPERDPHLGELGKRLGEIGEQG
jgi:hypothetical protein